MVILITGKAGAGKTTYAKKLSAELIAAEKPVIHIDGDDFRNTTKNNDYTDTGRLNNLMDAARMASEWEAKGNIIIMSFIAPKKIWRNEMRTLFKCSRVVYIPGGTLWEGTTYETPTDQELQLR